MPSLPPLPAALPSSRADWADTARRLRRQVARTGVGVGACFSPSRRRYGADVSVVRTVAGIAGIAVGVGLILAAGLGAGPWDVAAAGFSELTGTPLFVVFWLVGAAQLAAAAALKERPRFGTFLPSLLCGPLVDLTVTSVPAPPSLAAAASLFAAGAAVLTVGAGAFLTSGCTPGPSDLVFRGLAARGLAPWQSRLVVEGPVLGLGLAVGGPAGPGTALLTVGMAFAIPAAVSAFPPVRRRRAVLALAS